MEPFIGQISLFAFNLVPKGWLRCQGQILPIAQYQALYSLLGPTFGGDSKTTFGLPDLRGRVPVNPSTALGIQGTKLGQETVTLTMEQVPAHYHTVAVAITDGTALTPQDSVLATNAKVGANDPFYAYAPASVHLVALAPATVDASGGGAAHSNMQPSLGLNFCISNTGTYPQRSY